MGQSDIVTRFERQVRAAVEIEGLMSRPLVVAVSGGADSLALLYALHRLEADIGTSLHVAHLDHRLRGRAAADDADFVAQTCTNLGIAHTVEAADVLGFQREYRTSREEAAREVRYRFLSRVSERAGTDVVALGHTSDDQVETVLMHLIRGSGLRGLRGMRTSSKRRVAGVELTLFRPILNLSKQDTTNYCQALELQPRFDESNRSTELMRNKIRWELLTLLRELNPSFGDAVLRLARNADEALAIVDRAVDSAWSEVVIERRDHICIDRQRFRELDEGVRSHVVMRAFSHVKGDTGDIERVHVENVVRSIVGSSGTELHLPGRLRLTIEQRMALLSGGAASPPIERLPAIESFPLAVPGVTIAGPWRIVVERILNPRTEIVGRRPGDRVARLGGAIDDSTLALRTRMPGDRFQPLGMSRAKKLKDFMIDEKIPGSLRDGVPLVITSRGIAWVVGWRIAEWARINDSDDECVEITIERTR